MKNKEKPKGIIIQVGYFDKDDKPQEWILDNLGIVPAFEITKTGEEFYAGYTLDELRKISQVH